MKHDRRYKLGDEKGGFMAQQACLAKAPELRLFGLLSITFQFLLGFTWVSCPLLFVYHAFVAKLCLPITLSRDVKILN